MSMTVAECHLDWNARLGEPSARGGGNLSPGPVEEEEEEEERREERR